MLRLRVGLAGLGLVFLIVMVASVLFAPARAPKAQSGETLAMLGVAPGPAAKPADPPKAAAPAAIRPTSAPPAEPAPQLLDV